MSAAEMTETQQRRAPGRPSVAEPLRGWVTGLLATQPEIRAMAIVGLAATQGYTGRKSALYHLIARIRYRATRHTFASHWVMAGRPIEQLSVILGHSSVMVTEIYAHLKPENLTIPDVFAFGRRVEDPKAALAAAVDDGVAAELAAARAQVARLTALLEQQGAALARLAAATGAGAEGRAA